ncbi:MAG: type IX secretion system PorP/SprF family membrane protein [Sediminicola sp.]|jgi:type IX secretion system PorP/SprF family membrane protein
MIKRGLYLIKLCLLCLPHLSVGQGTFDRSQSHIHPEWNDAATIGIQPQPIAGLAYRQYVNQTGVGLSTYEAGFSMPLNINYNAENDNSGFFLSSPELQNKIKTNRDARRKHGLGINLRSLQYDIYQINEVQISYAFHLPLSKAYNLSIGTSFNYGVSSINAENLTVRDPFNDMFYQGIINANSATVRKLSSNIGLAFYSKDLLISANFKNIILFEQGNLQSAATSYKKMIQPHFFVSYKWDFGQKIYLSPNFIYNYSLLYGNTFSGNLRVNYNSSLYLGIGLQNNSRISGLLGIKLTRDIFMNYSYDFNNNYGELATNGVHELSINYLFKNKRARTPFLW